MLYLFNLYLEKFLQHTITINSLILNQEISNLIINLLQTFQTHIRLERNILNNSRTLKYGNSVWITQWMYELREFDIRIYIPQTINLQIQRWNERSLMNIIFDKTKNDNIFEQIIICRKYLKIIFLSDMITPYEGYISFLTYFNSFLTKANTYGLKFRSLHNRFNLLWINMS